MAVALPAWDLGALGFGLWLKGGVLGGGAGIKGNCQFENTNGPRVCV